MTDEEAWQSTVDVFRSAHDTLAATGEKATAAVVRFFDTPEGERKAVIGHSGDSRVWLMREGWTELGAMTLDNSSLEKREETGTREDQLAVSKAADRADLSPEQNKLFDQRHTTAKVSLGAEQSGATARTIDVQPGDQFLLTTKGVHNNLTSREIEAILSATNDPKVATQRLTEAAKERSGDSHFRADSDNDMTAVVIKVPHTPVRETQEPPSKSEEGQVGQALESIVADENEVQGLAKDIIALIGKEGYRDAIVEFRGYGKDVDVNDELLLNMVNYLYTDNVSGVFDAAKAANPGLMTELQALQDATTTRYENAQRLKESIPDAVIETETAKLLEAFGADPTVDWHAVAESDDLTFYHVISHYTEDPIYTDDFSPYDHFKTVHREIAELRGKFPLNEHSKPPEAYDETTGAEVVSWLNHLQRLEGMIGKPPAFRGHKRRADTIFEPLGEYYKHLPTGSSLDKLPTPIASSLIGMIAKRLPQLEATVDQDTEKVRASAESQRILFIKNGRLLEERLHIDNPNGWATRRLQALPGSLIGDLGFIEFSENLGTGVFDGRIFHKAGEQINGENKLEIRVPEGDYAQGRKETAEVLYHESGHHIHSKKLSVPQLRRWLEITDAEQVDISPYVAATRQGGQEAGPGGLVDNEDSLTACASI